MIGNQDGDDDLEDGEIESDEEEPSQQVAQFNKPAAEKKATAHTGRDTESGGESPNESVQDDKQTPLISPPECNQIGDGDAIATTESSSQMAVPVPPPSLSTSNQRSKASKKQKLTATGKNSNKSAPQTSTSNSNRRRSGTANLIEDDWAGDVQNAIAMALKRNGVEVVSSPQKSLAGTRGTEKSDISGSGQNYPSSKRKRRNDKDRRKKRIKQENDKQSLLNAANDCEDVDEYEMLCVRGGSPPLSNVQHSRGVGGTSKSNFMPIIELSTSSYDSYDSESEYNRRNNAQSSSSSMGNVNYDEPISSRRRHDNNNLGGGSGNLSSIQTRTGHHGGGGSNKSNKKNDAPNKRRSNQDNHDMHDGHHNNSNNPSGGGGSHHRGQSQQHNPQQPRIWELCKFYLHECCAKRDKCSYLHGDFPCKEYYLGMKCGAKDACKFSHGRPLDENLRAILLKHIETAPKEILGDFPRINRDTAMNLLMIQHGKLCEKFLVENTFVMPLQSMKMNDSGKIGGGGGGQHGMMGPNNPMAGRNTPKTDQKSPRRSRWCTDSADRMIGTHSPVLSFKQITDSFMSTMATQPPPSSQQPSMQSPLSSLSSQTSLLSSPSPTKPYTSSYGLLKNLPGLLKNEEINILSQIGIETIEQLNELTVGQLSKLGIEISQIVEIQKKALNIQQLGSALHNPKLPGDMDGVDLTNASSGLTPTPIQRPQQAQNFPDFVSGTDLDMRLTPPEPSALASPTVTTDDAKLKMLNEGRDIDMRIMPTASVASSPAVAASAILTVPPPPVVDFEKYLRDSNICNADTERTKTSERTPAVEPIPITLLTVLQSPTTTGQEDDKSDKLMFAELYSTKLTAAEKSSTPLLISNCKPVLLDNSKEDEDDDDDDDGDREKALVMEVDEYDDDDVEPKESERHGDTVKHDADADAELCKQNEINNDLDNIKYDVLATSALEPPIIDYQPPVISSLKPSQSTDFEIRKIDVSSAAQAAVTDLTSDTSPVAITITAVDSDRIAEVDQPKQPQPSDYGLIYPSPIAGSHVAGVRRDPRLVGAVTSSLTTVPAAVSSVTCGMTSPPAIQFDDLSNPSSSFLATKRYVNIYDVPADAAANSDLEHDSSSNSSLPTSTAAAGTAASSHSDRDMRIAPYFVEADSVNGDTDLRLPFKPIMKTFVPAKEIDASITSYVPKDYKVLEVDVAKPDYSDIQRNLSASDFTLDPRLRRLFPQQAADYVAASLKPSSPITLLFSDTDLDTIGSPIATTIQPQIAPAVRVDPRRKRAAEQMAAAAAAAVAATGTSSLTGTGAITAAGDTKIVSSIGLDIPQVLQKSDWYKLLSSNYKITVNQQLANLTTTLRNHNQLKPNEPVDFQALFAHNLILQQILQTLGIYVTETGEFFELNNDVDIPTISGTQLNAMRPMTGGNNFMRLPPTSQPPPPPGRPIPFGVPPFGSTGVGVSNNVGLDDNLRAGILGVPPFGDSLLAGGGYESPELFNAQLNMFNTGSNNQLANNRRNNNNQRWAQQQLQQSSHAITLISGGGGGGGVSVGGASVGTMGTSGNAGRVIGSSNRRRDDYRQHRNNPSNSNSNNNGNNSNYGSNSRRDRSNNK